MHEMFFGLNTIFSSGFMKDYVYMLPQDVPLSKQTIQMLETCLSKSAYFRISAKDLMNLECFDELRANDHHLAKEQEQRLEMEEFHQINEEDLVSLDISLEPEGSLNLGPDLCQKYPNFLRRFYRLVCRSV